jgi:hypothetical protein
MVADVLAFISVTHIRSQPQYCMSKSSTGTDVTRILVYSYYHNIPQVLVFRFHQQIVCGHVYLVVYNLRRNETFKCIQRL